jgi:hypothetical protein
MPNVDERVSQHAGFEKVVSLGTDVDELAVRVFSFSYHKDFRKTGPATAAASSSMAADCPIPVAKIVSRP